MTAGPMTSGHRWVVLPAPSTNRVYADAAAALVAAELRIALPGLADDAVRPVTIGGVTHVEVGSDAPLSIEALAEVTSVWMAYERVDDLLRPLDLPRRRLLDDDLLTIPKYRGKTNEQFTRLLVGVALAGRVAPLPTGRRLELLDPLCGRGTTLSAAWLRGIDGYGVEADVAAIEAHATFLTTWLRRKRLKHSIELTPLRRDGVMLGKRLAASVRLPDGERPLETGVLTGDARDSGRLWGKRRFDLVVTDAPYGVVHGSRRSDGAAGRDRSAAGLLAEGVAVWAGQLRPGGVLAIAWNTLNLPREELAALLREAGLDPCDDGPWRGLAHQVDSSIRRDVLVGVAPGAD